MTKPRSYIGNGHPYFYLTPGNKKFLEENFSTFQAEQISNPRSKYLLACCYQYGFGVEINYKKAFDLFQAGYEQGYIPSIVSLSVCYITAIGTEINYAMAFNLANDAHKAGCNNSGIMTNLGIYYSKGLGTPQNQKMAVEFFENGSKSNDPRALVNLGIHYYCGDGVAQDLGMALKLYEDAYKCGYSRAMIFLGNHHKKMNNPARAFALYKEAVALGDVYAFSSLGKCYEDGIGIYKDPIKAFRLYKKGADLGDPLAMVYLANCYKEGIYESGIIVEKNKSLAFALYQKAAELRDVEAITCLGDCYKEGIGVTKNKSEAARLYKEASDLGDISAIEKFGISCFETGSNILGIYYLSKAFAVNPAYNKILAKHLMRYVYTASDKPLPKENCLNADQIIEIITNLKNNRISEKKSTLIYNITSASRRNLSPEGMMQILESLRNVDGIDKKKNSSIKKIDQMIKLITQTVFTDVEYISKAHELTPLLPAKPARGGAGGDDSPDELRQPLFVKNFSKLGGKDSYSKL